MRRYVVTQSRFTRESRTRTSSPDETSTSSSISSGTRTRGSWGFQRSRKIPPSTICGVQTNWSSWHKREPPTPDLDRQTHMKGQTDETRAIAVVQGQNAAKISTLCEYRPPPPHPVAGKTCARRPACHWCNLIAESCLRMYTPLPPLSAEQRWLVLALAAHLRPMQHAPVTRRKAALAFYGIATASKPPAAS